MHVDESLTLITLTLEISPKIRESETSTKSMKGRRDSQSQTHIIETCLFMSQNISYYLFSDKGHIFSRNSLPFQKGTIYLLVISHTED